MVGRFLLAFVLVILAFSASPSEAGMECTAAVRYLVPCTPFLVGFGPEAPSASCCAGAQDVFKQADTPEARRDLCKCLKNAITGIGAIPERAKQLPEFCKIDVPVPIDENADCSK
ncbi:Non-specific lipid-transfer protein [Morella rubra]|uniref:Non-specific lipid-transfer protein n=1 Tax=Morella rubra TaxID=262757 RepID=A0A6A1WA81_9ROSI|nr:Non-specific lipid-transfer protein [Morella rubra]